MKTSELIIDSFAGGGGASLGIAWATGRAPDIALNHDPNALAMHAENHPSTNHVLEDVWRADLRSLTKGRPVGLLWASPDCRHFSRAKGGKPVSKRVRSLAWIVCKWADQVQPRVICLENVREFADWGPLVPAWACRQCAWRGTEGQATLVRTKRKCPRCESKRLTITEDLIPCPARKGVTFRRFVARLKKLGYEVEWKNLNAADYGAPTHRRRLFLIARRDGEPICWPEPTHGDPKELQVSRLWKDDRRPFRTAAECIDWNEPCPSIFSRSKPLADKTMRRIALGIKRYVLEAQSPFIVQLAHGEGKDGRWGSGSKGLDEPLGTVHSGGGNHALVAPYVVPMTHDGERRIPSIEDPLPTITTAKRGELALVSAFLAKHFGGVVGVPINTPLPTTTQRATQNQIVAANLVRFNFDDAGVPIDAPLPTVTKFNHAGLVYSFLVRYFGTAIGQHLTEPMFTITGKDRFGLITVQVDGEPYVIVDIGMRMLTPRELARAQGFPDTYILKGTKTSQVARIGNSVCPPIARAIVAANYCLEFANA